MTEESVQTVQCITVNDPKTRPRRSATIGKLGMALAKAQGEMLNAEKDVKGNYGKYATLASTWDSIRGPLSKFEIAVYQRPLPIDDKIVMCTMLIHSSGEFIDDGELELIYDKSGGRLSPMQAMGSAVTYARRYTLQAATGIAPADDDDGESAGRPTPPPAQPAKNVSKPKSAPPVQPKSPAPVGPSLKDPVDQPTMDKIIDLAMQREVHEGALNALVQQGYGFNEFTPQWVANEIVSLLSNVDTNEATVMAEIVKIQNRREAAALAKTSGT